MSVVSIVCCQVEVSATSWSLVQRSPTDCGAKLCVIWKPREWEGPGPLGEGGCCAKRKKISPTHQLNPQHSTSSLLTALHCIYPPLRQSPTRTEKKNQGQAFRQFLLLTWTGSAKTLCPLHSQLPVNLSIPTVRFDHATTAVTENMLFYLENRWETLHRCDCGST